MAGIDSTDRRQRRVPRAAGPGMNHPLRRAETIDVTDAVLGTTRTFPSLDGKLKVIIPAGKQPDEILRLNGKGLPRFRGSGRGDINIRIQVHVPEEVSKKERKLYEQLRELH